MSEFAKMCRNGEDCSNRKCSFIHPWQRIEKIEKSKLERKEKQKCKHGKKCIRPDCHFDHPSERNINDVLKKLKKIPCKKKKCDGKDCPNLHT